MPPADTSRFSPEDRAAMAEALAAAEASIALSDPNPRVGCVLVGAQGQRAVGHTQRAGQAHAEVMALRAAREAGWDPRGATAYVSLEPCSHFGRTPPCCDALIAAGVARVVAAAIDPNPRVAGGGLQRLREAGLAVDHGLMANEAEALNVGFFHRMRHGRPWVRLKVAASLDGRTALADGRSRWITGADARRDGQGWRRRAQAVLTGVGTVLADDPRLDVRDWPAALQPLRVVLDRGLRTPPSARLLAPPGAVLLVADPTAGARADALREAGAEVLLLPEPDRTFDALLTLLAGRGVNELHVEAGPTLNGALLAADVVDELLLYLAPLCIGPGRPLADLPALPGLDAAARWTWTEAVPVGADLRLRARRQPR
ncbi:bifunctional diaminohydroxyphosphoribosylaminopyrimidine deaminase/5-amino-6-(5-phosphoribosylamino)uracil reductase RibD [Aquabacterium sp. J223]|uniref:bifunctional diaminohydroxyphosphoribosylaminopyrimidine deaminase/5-amino-6-(5-phosphoribosylamino)uracil reductase RibD n=1 Tax=Aquabacterium sp. J223 TaxID=2898431 RepID=UPI0021ADDF35|nr:bifunctional diaminohydroxyphosphoribosylaminopyrimidine deaminase/5-amino-6-(5-phosphoribosylamino)uracil reductase RibD [Aquabacterium sp. J223]UUX94606.1 bifunctional diaminohydroxyphosphoribosylaminopyrimidine deaminase/5-amino-6-(5-phosphoribosylamino)uracil reductase RibD [Aquabacterium sp. J223]